MSQARQRLTNESQTKRSSFFCCLFSCCMSAEPDSPTRTIELEGEEETRFRHEWVGIYGSPEDYPSWQHFLVLAQPHLEADTLSELLHKLKCEYNFITARTRANLLKNGEQVPKVKLSVSELEIWNSQNLAKVIVTYLKSHKTKLEQQNHLSPEEIDFNLVVLKKHIQKKLYLPLLEMLDIAVKQHSDKFSRDNEDDRAQLDDLIRVEKLYHDELIGSPRRLRK